MKHIIVRTTVAALVAAGSFAPLAMQPKPAPQKPQSPIPICWQCGRGGVSK